MTTSKEDKDISQGTNLKISMNCARNLGNNPNSTILNAVKSKRSRWIIYTHPRQTNQSRKTTHRKNQF